VCMTALKPGKVYCDGSRALSQVSRVKSAVAGPTRARVRCALIDSPEIEGVTVAAMEIDGDDAVLKLGRMEDVEAMHAHAVSAPLTAVQSVEGVADPWPELRGVKEVGTEIPGKTMVGTRRGQGFKDFCAVHKAGPAVIVTLDPAVSEYDRWIFSGDINDVPAGLKR
jgi:hypothetical protein